MEPNEMRRYRYQNDFPNDYDGIVEDNDGELVFYEDAMQIITALQSKIDGMIKRPVVEVVETLDQYGDFVRGKIMIDGKVFFDDGDPANKMLFSKNIAQRLTTALGMDDAKEGGEG